MIGHVAHICNCLRISSDAKTRHQVTEVGRLHMLQLHRVIRELKMVRSAIASRSELWIGILLKQSHSCHSLDIPYRLPNSADNSKIDCSVVFVGEISINLVACQVQANNHWDGRRLYP